jgi:hypothetical protein
MSSEMRALGNRSSDVMKQNVLKVIKERILKDTALVGSNNWVETISRF